MWKLCLMNILNGTSQLLWSILLSLMRFLYYLDILTLSWSHIYIYHECNRVANYQANYVIVHLATIFWQGEWLSEFFLIITSDLWGDFWFQYHPHISQSMEHWAILYVIEMQNLSAKGSNENFFLIFNFLCIRQFFFHRNKFPNKSREI